MKRPLGYLDGLGTGIAVIGLAVAAWIATAAQHMGAIYQDLNPAAVGAATRLVLSPAWRIGVPLVLVAALVAGHVWRPRYGLLAVAVLAIAVDVFWYLTAWAPVFELSGNIR